MIKHIWFDFSDTIALIKKDSHDQLRYETYAKVVNKPLTSELVAEYERLFKENKNSNSSAFKSLGMLASFWLDLVSNVNPSSLYGLTDSNIPEVLEKMSKIIPISVFSNINVNKILPALGIDSKWFTHILSAGMIGAPKPALDGFYKMIELSGVSPDEILYIGDDIGKDIIPAKTVGIQTGAVFMKLEEADYSFTDFRDILEFVKSKNLR